MKILTIKGTDIEELLSMPECIEQMKLALRYQSEGTPMLTHTFHKLRVWCVKIIYKIRVA